MNRPVTPCPPSGGGLACGTSGGSQDRSSAGVLCQGQPWHTGRATRGRWPPHRRALPGPGLGCGCSDPGLWIFVPGFVCQLHVERNGPQRAGESPGRRHTLLDTQEPEWVGLLCLTTPRRGGTSVPCIPGLSGPRSGCLCGSPRGQRAEGLTGRTVPGPSTG